MLRHVVVWTFHEHAEGRTRTENVAEARRLLGRCAGIDGVRRYEVGVDELASAASAHLALVADFDDWDAYRAYVVHPDHEALKAFLAGVRDTVQMVDYEW